MKHRYHHSIVPVILILSVVVVLASSRMLHAQPAPPAFKHLEPIHADGSPAERISPIIQKAPPLDPAPPSMGYYETKWRRWDAVIMPRLPEKRPPAAVQPEPIPAPAEESDSQPSGETLPPLDLPPLLPERDGIPFLPGEPTRPPTGGGEPTPAVPPTDESDPEPGSEELEDLFRDPLGSDEPRRTEPAAPELVPPPSDTDPFEDDDPPPVSDDLFPADPPSDPAPPVELEEGGEEGDVDLDDLFQIPLDEQSHSPPYLRAPARKVSAAASSQDGMVLLRAVRASSGHQAAPQSLTRVELHAADAPLPRNAQLQATGDGEDELNYDQSNPLRPAGWRPAAELIPASYIETPKPRPVGNPLR